MELPDVMEKEAQRLRVLRDLALLDVAPNPRYDRLTLLAQQVFDVPVVLMTLVDADRIRFLSAHGWDLAEIEREVLPCNRVVANGKTLVIEDTHDKPQFETQAGQGIAFYAGAPLKMADGLAIGTLCLLDWSPRKLDLPQRALLQHLADTAMDVIEKHEIETFMEDGASSSRLYHYPAPEGGLAFEGIQRLFEESPSGVAWVDGNGQFLAINAAFESMLSQPAENLLGRKCWDWGIDQESRWEAALFNALVEKERMDYQLERTATIGDESILMDVRAVACPPPTGPVNRVLYFIQPAAKSGVERGRHEEVKVAGGDGSLQPIQPLWSGSSEPDALSGQIEEMMAALQAISQVLHEHPEETLSPLFDEMRNVVQSLADPLQDVATVFAKAFDASRPLEVILEQHVEQVYHTAGLEVVLHTEGLPDKLPQAIKEAVLVIVREGLDNVARHAGVAEAQLRLCADGPQLYVELSDEGIGFDAASQLASHADVGWTRMEDVAIAAGGQVRIEAEPDAGTILIAEFSLETT